MKSEIRGFLKQNGAGGDVTELADHESLLQAGVIDSAAMIDLITYLESKHGITIDEDDMVPEHFDSLNAISSYVNAKKTG